MDNETSHNRSHRESGIIIIITHRVTRSHTHLYRYDDESLPPTRPIKNSPALSTMDFEFGFAGEVISNFGTEMNGKWFSCGGSRGLGYSSSLPFRGLLYNGLNAKMVYMVLKNLSI